MEDQLRVYLTDHHAALTGAAALAGRSLRSNPDNPVTPHLEAMERGLKAARDALGEELEARGWRPQPGKEAAMAAAVWVGRFKPNGQRPWGDYSPLGRMVELETLEAAATYEARLWRNLAIIGSERVDPSQLAEEAEHRRARMREALEWAVNELVQRQSAG